MDITTLPLNTINVVQLAITDDVIIQGPQEGPAILQGPAFPRQQFTGAGRILDIAANVNVSIKRLWFQRGDAVDTPDNSDTFGGAIRNAGNLTLATVPSTTTTPGLPTSVAVAVAAPQSPTLVRSLWRAARLPRTWPYTAVAVPSTTPARRR